MRRLLRGHCYYYAARFCCCCWRVAVAAAKPAIFVECALCGFRLCDGCRELLVSPRPLRESYAHLPPPPMIVAVPPPRVLTDRVGCRENERHGAFGYCWPQANQTPECAMCKTTAGMKKADPDNDHEKPVNRGCNHCNIFLCRECEFRVTFPKRHVLRYEPKHSHAFTCSCCQQK